jgi:hypothetical protein
MPMEPFCAPIRAPEPLPCRWLGRFVIADVISDFPAAGLGLFEPVAVAVQFQDVDVVSETVEQRAGEPLGAEDGRPFLERQVGSDDDKRTFIVSDKRSLRPRS